MSEQPTIVILAAGKGERMRSRRPKLLHRVAGRTLIGHVLTVATGLGAARCIVVLAPGMDAVAAEVAGIREDAAIAIQREQLGTGDAVRSAMADIPRSGSVLVLYGDTPLLRRETLERLLRARRESDAAVAVLGMRPPDSAGYGRLVVDGDELQAIVEDRHASETLRTTAPCNSGVMAFDAARLEVLLDALELQPEKSEYYLTDVVAHARARGWRCTAIEGPWQDGIGVNSPAQLADAEALMQMRLREQAMAGGAVLQAPETVHLCADTVIGPDCEIGPYVVFGPGVSIAAGARVLPFCHLEGAELEPGAVVGPFARLRPGAVVGPDARVGNFVEVKNVALGRGAKANHLSYLGDGEVGAGANVGAGTIFCNYDGFTKRRTEIGAGAFIGSNVALVAEVKVGAGAMVAAGSTITGDVPEDALTVARGRQRTIEEGAKRFRARHRKD
jgi:bifunctional UDP-N-acetylglucosamine pyrophosphorylase/glucosamine-1-phosphate N-acetyltransferase